MYNPDPQSEFDNSQQRTDEALAHYKGYLTGRHGLVDIEFADMPMYADSDYLVYIDGYFHHFLEVKTRRSNKFRYERTKVPLRKHAVAKYWKDTKDWDTFFLCCWYDEFGLFDLTEEPNEVASIVARHDRGEEKDVYAFYNVTSARKV